MVGYKWEYYIFRAFIIFLVKDYYLYEIHNYYYFLRHQKFNLD